MGAGRPARTSPRVLAARMPDRRTRNAHRSTRCRWCHRDRSPRRTGPPALRRRGERSRQRHCLAEDGRHLHTPPIRGAERDRFAAAKDFHVLIRIARRILIDDENITLQVGPAIAQQRLRVRRVAFLSDGRTRLRCRRLRSRAGNRRRCKANSLLSGAEAPTQAEASIRRPPQSDPVRRQIARPKHGWPSSPFSLRTDAACRSTKGIHLNDLTGKEFQSFILNEKRRPRSSGDIQPR
jgi:hypothetical protein